MPSTVVAEDSRAVWQGAGADPGQVTADEVTPTGTVTVLDDHRVLGTATLVDGPRSCSSGKGAQTGHLHPHRDLLGDEQVEPGRPRCRCGSRTPAGH